MATLAQAPRAQGARDEPFFLTMAIVMALTAVAGFSVQLAAGRSTFASPPLVHAHAIIFFGWIVIYLLQNVFVATGSIALHRRLGWVATGWVAAMIVLGTAVTVVMVRAGHVPFFFRPQHFLIFDPLALTGFAALIAAGIANRRRTAWHRRLNFCATAILMGPAFGRLLPMPLLAPFAYEATFVATLIYPVIGVVADMRRTGRVHPGWTWGIGAMCLIATLTEVVTYSPLGTAIYSAVTAGSPGASVAPLDFAPPPSGPLITGR